MQTDNDCKKNNFEESLLPVQLFFKMFDSLTNYKGMEDGLHKYQMIQLDKDNKVTPQFFFYFDTDLKLVKTRLLHHEVGHYDFAAVRPIQEKAFVEKDFYQIECDQLSEVVIQESNSFAGFMQKFVYHLVGIEDDLLGYLGLSPKGLKP